MRGAPLGLMELIVLEDWHALEDELTSHLFVSLALSGDGPLG